MQIPAPIIDTHVHFFDPARPGGVPWPPEDDALLHRTVLPPEFRALALPLGIAGAVVVEASPWIEDNAWLLNLARENPVVRGVVGNLRPGTPSFAADLRRFAPDPLFRGIRVSGRAIITKWRENAAYRDDLARLADADLSLDLLGDATMLPYVARLATALPSLRVVLNHLPFAEWDTDPASARRALAEVAALPNVYAKVSGVVRSGANGQPVTDPAIYHPRLDGVRGLFGPDRALFGSNWPVCERIAPYPTVLSVAAAYFAERPADEAERFFTRNAAAAYGLPHLPHKIEKAPRREPL